MWLASFLCAQYTYQSYAGRFMEKMFKISKHVYTTDLKAKKTKKRAYKTYKR